MDWKDDKNRGPWPFFKQPNKWGYLNNPRWQQVARKFYHGGPDDYDGRESEEPQIWTPNNRLYPGYSRDDQPHHHQCGHWHLPTGAPTQPIQIPLEMCQGWFYPDTSDQKYTASELHVDPNDYIGLETAYFEVCVDLTDLTTTSNVLQLIDEFGNIYATVSGDDHTLSSGGVGSMYHRLRYEITLGATARNYYVKFLARPDFINIDGSKFTIILEGTFLTCKPQIELCADDDSAAGWAGSEDGNNYYAYACIGNRTSYGFKFTSIALPSDPTPFRQFYLDKSKWANIDYWEFEVIGGGGTFSTPILSKFALFNAGTDTVIPTSELEFTNILPVRKVVTIDPNDLPDLANLEARMLITDNSGFNTVKAYRINLYPRLSNLSKLEAHWRHGTSIRGGTTPVYDYTFRNYHSPLVPENTPIFFECTAKAKTGGTGNGHISLYSVGLSDVGRTCLSEVPLNSVISTDGASGAWTNADVAHLNETDGSFAQVILNLANDVAYLETWGFRDYLGRILDELIPAGIDISEVTIKVDLTVSGQNATVSARCAGIWHTLAAQALSPVVYGLAFACITDKAWVKADLLDGVLVSEVRVNQPGNTTPTAFSVDKVAMNIGWGNEIVQSALTFSTTTRERLRSGNIASYLVDGNRHITYFYIPSSNDTILEHSLTSLIYEITL